MFNKRSYAIYYSDEDYGKISGISSLEKGNFLVTTNISKGEYPQNEIPLFAYQLASIKKYLDKESAKDMIV